MVVRYGIKTQEDFKINLQSSLQSSHVQNSKGLPRNHLLKTYSKVGTLSNSPLDY